MAGICWLAGALASLAYCYRHMSLRPWDFSPFDWVAAPFVVWILWPMLLLHWIRNTWGDR